MKNSVHRWFAIKLWREWTTDGEVFGLEESIHLVRSESKAGAESAARILLEKEEVTSYEDELGQPVNFDGRTVSELKIRGKYIEFIDDLGTNRIRDKMQIFGQLFRADDDGNIEVNPFDLPPLG